MQKHTLASLHIGNGLKVNLPKRKNILLTLPRAAGYFCGPSTSAPNLPKKMPMRSSLPSRSRRRLCHQRWRRIWSSRRVGTNFSRLRTSAVVSAWYLFFPSASIQRPLAFLRMKLIPLQAVNWSKALQSARLGRRVSHPVRSVDQTMLRKIMRLTRCEHSALQKRPRTVHPACAARRRVCLSATLLQL